MLWTPSKLIARLGKEINDKSSYLYWAYKASVHSSFCSSLMARLDNRLKLDFCRVIYLFILT